MFYYLFEPNKITLAFPYVHNSASLRIGLSSYMGRTTFERPYGGLLFNSPVLLLSLVVWKVRKYITDKNRKSYQIAVFFTGSAFLILLADIQIGGIMNRYHMDFGIFLCISAMVVMAVIQNKMKEYRLLKWLHILLASSVVWRFLYEIALWFDDGFMLVQRPLLIFYLRNIIEFWH